MASSLIRTPLSLASSLIPSLGLRSLLGPLGFLVHPYTLVALALMTSHGWAYWKGKRNAYAEQAAAVLAINAEIAKWRDRYEAAERINEDRLRDAQDAATAILNAQGSDEKCLMNEALAKAILEIAGDR